MSEHLRLDVFTDSECAGEVLQLLTRAMDDTELTTERWLRIDRFRDAFRSAVCLAEWRKP